MFSVAGPADRNNVSTTTIQPFATLLLGGGWSLNTTAEMSYNWQAQAGDRWIIPISVGASRVVDFSGRYVNLGAAMVGYVEKPTFAPDWELRFSATYVVR